MRIRGYVDAIVGDALVGWTLDEDDPNRRLTVRAELDGRALGSAVADQPRTDLKRSAIGDGNAGFRLPLDPALLSEGLHDILVEVVDADQALRLADDWVVLNTAGAVLRGVTVTQAHPGLVSAGALTPADQTRPLAVYARQAAPAISASIAPPAAPTAIVGTSGWLFPRPAHGFDAARGIQSPSHAQLDALAAGVEEIHEAARGIGAAVVVAFLPDKLHAYSEHLPAGMRTDPTQRRSRLLTARLRDSDTADVLDLLPILLDARAHGRVYSRTGGRLTWIGAFHAYRGIAKLLQQQQPAVIPIPVAQFDFGPLEPVVDTLAAVPLAVWIDDDFVRVDGVHMERPEDSEPGLDPTAAKLEAALKRALVVHDGRGARVAELLARHAQEPSIVVAPRVDPLMIKASRPDIVVWLTGDTSVD